MDDKKCLNEWKGNADLDYRLEICPRFTSSSNVHA